uniref:Uncharacterized protein n=1 Tax=Arundo donax TaxID=35708 RepID=A0A0A9H8L2_ARUDO
MLTPIVHLPSH